MFFRWLHGEKWTDLKVLREEKKTKENQTFSQKKRDRAIIAVGYEAGLRNRRTCFAYMGEMLFGLNGELRSKFTAKLVKGSFQ